MEMLSSQSEEKVNDHEINNLDKMLKEMKN